MKVSNTVLECLYCGCKETIPDKATARSFMIAFNKFKRVHDWKCESEGKSKARVEQFRSDVNKEVLKAMRGAVE